MQSFHNENELATIVIGLALKVHKDLGPGLLERTYQECLYFLLVREGLFVEKEKRIPLFYEDVYLECGFRIDLLVENKLVIEIKSTEYLIGLHTAQTLTYLRLGQYKLGLLINFNNVLLSNGLKRVINGKIE
jgi:GxxExxY protein